MTAAAAFSDLPVETIDVALSYLDANCDRDTWARIGMALKAELGEPGFDVWDQWSRRADNYSQRDARDTWRSIKATGGVTIATLIHMAKENGYRPDAQPRQIDPVAAAARRAQREADAQREQAELEQRQARAAADAQAIWSHAQPTTTHAYIDRKGLATPGKVRIGTYRRWVAASDDMPACEVEIDGALLVPIRNPEGAIVSLQAIFPDGANVLGRDRDYLPGGRKQGCYFNIGVPTGELGETVLIGEGYATAASAHQATGHVAVVAFDAGNLLEVAKAIRSKLAHARIVLLADNDRWGRKNTGVEKATEAAKAVGGLVAIPQFASDDGQPTDFNDLHQREGLDAVRQQIRAALPALSDMTNTNGNAPAKRSSAPDSSGDLDCIDGIPVPVALAGLLSEDASAEAIAKRHAGRLLFDIGLNRFRFFEDGAWREDRTARGFELAREQARHAVQMLESDPEMKPEQRARLARAIASARWCAGVEKFLRTDQRIVALPESFDANQWLINTPSGTFDVSKGVLSPHQADDRLTKITGVPPDREPSAPVFTRFLEEVTEGDADLQHFLQVALGYGLTGDTSAHSLFFFVGSGRNGKSTLIELVDHVVGNYGKKVMSTLLLSDPRGDRHPTELANLRGARLAYMSELPEGAVWDEAKMKELTGDRRISARVMRGDPFEFDLTAKLFVLANHRSQLRATDPATKARLKCVPFRASFAGREDRQLPDRLKAEGPAVLAWLLAGASEWHRERRLPVCEAVDTETSEYMASQSTPELWLAERCDLLPGRSTRARDLYADYRAWKEERGEAAVSQTRWGEWLGSVRGIRKIHSGGTVYTGVGLLRSMP
jgi:P4 family phage/plasmid primase-like protien